VTRRTKRMANGVTARVVRDTASGAGRLIEDTFDFYAQDKRGNVWYLGEDTAELEAGRISSRAGSWQVGVNGAQAGIIIPARPRQGMRYREEYLEGQAEDRGQVLATGLAAQAPYGHFRSNLLIADTTPLEPRVLELKFYARTVGPLLTLNASGGAGRAELRSKDIAPPEWVTRAAEAPLGRGPTR